MPTMAPARRVDVSAWREGRVPPDVRRACKFIYQHKKCSWAEIAEHMGWADLPRDQWRNKMRRLKRWGVLWNLNTPGSTRIAAEVREYVAKL
jgi:hypothetical protein